MQVDLQGKVAIVTGGAQGIGRAIVQDLADNGARVVIVDIEKERAEASAKEVAEAGGSCIALAGDVADRQAMAKVAADTVAQWGAIDILVNNAGINTVRDRKPIHEYSFEDWERILRVDLTGVFVTSQACIPHMLDKGGRIVNITSIAGLVPLRLQSGFVSAKAGVVNLTKSMAMELGPKGILVNAVAPGSTLTRGTEALFYGKDGSYSEMAANLLSHVPLGRPGTTEEIAHTVLFLVAPEASYITGAIIVVDGGWTCGGFARDF
ncbi:MAG: SDR family NAD(P)-dependent oxidoreductase [Anaerolineae bacterium]